MVRRKSVGKKRSRNGSKRKAPQLSLPLENRQKNKPKAKSTVQIKSKPPLRNRIIFTLNCVLCVLIVFLLVVKILSRKGDYSPHVEVKNISVSGLKGTAYDANREHEGHFLDIALNHDEVSDFNLFQLEYGLQENLPAAEVPTDDWRRQITQVDNLNLTNEEIYHLKEEKLPEVAVGYDKHNQTLPGPMIAIVIDDMGVSISRTKDIASLKYPINASFLTYADNLKAQIANSAASGQEIMVHLPMEPQVMQNYTPTMLTTEMTDKEILSALRTMLDAVPEATAVNNHMGSKFTEDKHRMAVVMKELASRKIGFLDSKTTPKSAAPEQAERFGVNLTIRNVFLDNKDDFKYITEQLKQTEEIAKAKGFVIAIGHPKAQTYLALKAWLPTVEDKGLHLVTISELSKHLQEKSVLKSD